MSAEQVDYPGWRGTAAVVGEDNTDIGGSIHVAGVRDVKVSAHESAQADALRKTMINELWELGALRSARVADAFRAVPRHLFAPEAPLEEAYAANSSVVTKRDEHGRALSTVSAPSIQATMLEQAHLDAGMRVLEIGSGGYNAALIAELVGAEGKVTTVDIDPDVTDRARRCLATAGYGQVNVVLGDAEGGVTDHAPYDRVIVTVGAWDLPPAWVEQLAPGGRIIVPLRVRGLTRSVTFERENDRLVSLEHHLCGFVPMQGVGAHAERLVPVDGDEVGLRFDEDQQVEVSRLRDALFQPRVERWTGVEVDNVGDLDLWLATVTPVFGLLAATNGPVERGLVSGAALRGASTIIRGDSFAYRLKRPVPGTDLAEFGVYAHGPQAAILADEYVELIRTWYREHHAGPGARIELHPIATPRTQLPPGCVIDKRHTRVVISWP